MARRVEMFESLQDGGVCASRQGSFLESAGKAEIDSARHCRQARWFSPAGFSGTRTSLGRGVLPPSDPTEVRKPAAVPASLWGLLELCMYGSRQFRGFPTCRRAGQKKGRVETGCPVKTVFILVCFSSVSIMDLVRDRRLGSCQNQWMTPPHGLGTRASAR